MTRYTVHKRTRGRRREKPVEPPHEEPMPDDDRDGVESTPSDDDRSQDTIRRYPPRPRR